MSDIFITKIEIDEIRNLNNFLIPISSEEKKNLIITGKNGSGKTSLLNAITNNMNFLLEKGDYNRIEHDIKAFSTQLVLSKLVP